MAESDTSIFTSWELIIFLVWSTALFLFLAWTVNPAVASHGSPTNLVQQNQQNSNTGSSGKRSPRLKVKKDVNKVDTKIKWTRVGGNNTESTWVDSNNNYEQEGEDADDQVISSHSLDLASKVLLREEGGASSSPTVTLSKSISTASMTSLGNTATTTTTNRTTMAIPLRGRSQSSYSHYDISTTVTRRKGSADEIFVDNPASFPTYSSVAGGGAGGGGEGEGDIGSIFASVPNPPPSSPLIEGVSRAARLGLDINHKEIVKKGRLLKLGLSLSKKLTGEKTPVWKQRDFVLSGYYLSYLDSMKRRNEFDLRGCNVTCMIAHKGSGGLQTDLYAMSISSVNGHRHIVLGGSSEAHRDEWAACIEQQLIKIGIVEEENGGEVEEARYKGIPSPLEQILLNPPLPSRKRTVSSAKSILEEVRERGTSGASNTDSPPLK